MSKTIYEEALADVRQLKDIAETNAKRAIIEAVTPRIKDLIERQLLGESYDEELDEADGTTVAFGTVGAPGGSETATGDGSTAGGEDPVPPPGESNEGYEVTSEGLEALLPFSGRTKPIVQDRIELKIYELAEKTNELVIANSKTKAAGTFIAKINETIQEIEDMYSYVQESSDSSRKSKLESKLEKCFSVLTAVKETTMRMKDLVNNSLSEDKEVTLKVTGLPDDVELDKLNIDIISDEDDEMGAMPGEEMPPPGGEEDPMGGGEPPMPSESDMYEMDENEVVEISESMLKQEIARMKKLAEDKKVAPVVAVGHKMGSDILDDFGGGSDEGDPWEDGEVSTHEKDNMVKQGTVKESDGDADLDEGDDDLDEGDDDDLDEVQGDTKAKMDDDHLEESKKKLARATRALKEASDLALEAEQKFVSAKATYAKHKGGQHHNKAYALAEKAYKANKSAQKTVVEATTRMTAAKKSLNESLKNSGSKQLAESKAATESLRKQLVETNLLNAKLIQANKLLQLEGLSVHQKTVIIEKLDEAQNLREVKLVYESLVRALTGDKKTIKEGAQRSISGSSSRAAKPSGAPPAPLNEGAGVETARWAVLAGLSK